MKQTGFIRRHSILSYFVTTFIISWAAIIIVAIKSGIPYNLENNSILFPIIVVAMLLGPMIASFLLIGVVYGKEGFRQFRKRLFTVKINIGWYAVAVLATPALILAILLPLSISSADYLPAIFDAEKKLELLLMGLGVGIFGGFIEEFGWTGFVIPELRKKYGIFATGLIVGILWGIWHVLVTYWSSGDANSVFDPALFFPPLLFYMGVLPVFRVLMVFVYDRTNSLFIAGLMHASLTSTTVFILAPVDTHKKLMIYYVILTAILWAIVGIIALANGGKLSKRVIKNE